MQGDGEISLTALETRMQEVLIQIVLHKQKKFRWPVAETPTHWIIVGLDKDLNTAMSLAARNAIEFLATRAKLDPLDAYALCSIAVSFRVTQVVDIVRGVHAMIPKSLFTGECGGRSPSFSCYSAAVLRDRPASRPPQDEEKFSSCYERCASC